MSPLTVWMRPGEDAAVVLCRNRYALCRYPTLAGDAQLAEPGAGSSGS